MTPFSTAGRNLIDDCHMINYEAGGGSGHPETSPLRGVCTELDVDGS